MKTKMLLPAFLAIMGSATLFVTSCNRQDKSDGEGAGKGGNATLRVTPRHHGINIDSCMVYIKYNSSEIASTYDDSIWCVPSGGKPVATFSQLKKGNYYIYGKGWDPTIIQEVVGGIPFTITEEKTIDIEVPVTETH